MIESFKQITIYFVKMIYKRIKIFIKNKIFYLLLLKFKDFLKLLQEIVLN